MSSDGLALSSAFNLEYLSTLLTIAHSSPEAKKKQEIIEEYLLLLRSREEVELLENEAKNVIQYYATKKGIIEAEILGLSDSSDFSAGAKCLLTHLLHNVVQLLQDMQSSYAIMKESTNFQNVVCSSDSDSDSDMDCL